MLMRAISFFFLITSLTGCSHLHHHASSSVHKPAPNTPMPTFTRVKVDGNVDVALYTGALHPRVIINGSPADKAGIQITVKNGLLHVSEGNKHPTEARAQVEIRTRYLSSFSFKGKGTITGYNIQSRMLDLKLDNEGQTTLQGNMVLREFNVKGSGYTQVSGISGNILHIKMADNPHVQLRGIVDISSLNIHGNGWLSLYWVKSNALQIRATDRPFIQVAGIVDLLDVELWDSARFNGRYLRGTRVFAKTHDNSVADISVTKSQHTLATDTSNIYFHELPRMTADFMAYNGSVLDLREWGTPSQKEYTRYNR